MQVAIAGKQCRGKSPDEVHGCWLATCDKKSPGPQKKRSLVDGLQDPPFRYPLARPHGGRDEAGTPRNRIPLHESTISLRIACGTRCAASYESVVRNIAHNRGSLSGGTTTHDIPDRAQHLTSSCRRSTETAASSHLPFSMRQSPLCLPRAMPSEPMRYC